MSAGTASLETKAGEAEGEEFAGQADRAGDSGEW